METWEEFAKGLALDIFLILSTLFIYGYIAGMDLLVFAPMFIVIFVVIHTIVEAILYHR